MSPKKTVTAGTINSHRMLLMIACQNSLSPKMSRKFSKPTYSVLSAFAKE